jgi:YegS/Rv2252/BmrU family lipid kinase
MTEPNPTLLILARTKANGLGARLDSIEAELAATGPVIREVVEKPSDIPDRIVELSDRIDRVALGGGDGTLSTCGFALWQTGLPLQILPLGTANDLARTLGVPLDPVRAARLGREGRLADIDLAEVNGHHFFNAAGVGLTVDVAERLARGRKGLGPLSYLLAVLDILRARRSFRVRLQVDGENVVLRSIQVTVGNGVRHGGGIRMHRDACIDDGQFDLYSLEPQPVWRLLSLAPALLRGTHHAWRSVNHLRGRDVVLETPGKPKRINADGEIVSRTPGRFRLHRNAVLVYLPEHGPAELD